MNRLIGVLFLAFFILVICAPPLLEEVAVPEIDPSQAPSAIALLIGGLLICVFLDIGIVGVEIIVRRRAVRSARRRDETGLNLDPIVDLRARVVEPSARFVDRVRLAEWRRHEAVQDRLTGAAIRGQHPGTHQR